MACLGRIVAEQRLPDGRFHILLRGLSRCHISEEIQDEQKLYRLVRAELMPDLDGVGPVAGRKIRRRLQKCVPPLFAAQQQACGQVRKLFKSDIALGPLCDILAFVLPLEHTVKQKLLEETDVERRARLLLRLLERPRPERRFPPEFSAN
jgi:Lon protease-like protein